MDPIGLDRLIPDWRTDAERPLKTQVTDDRFCYLTEKGGFRLPNWPMPRLMSNHGFFVGSLGSVVRWLGTRAEALGVEIYPGFAASEALFGKDGELTGVATGDMGVGRDGKPKPSFVRGMELRGKYTLIAEGSRGSLAKQLIARFRLDEGRDPQKYGIGLKELWRVDPGQFRPGLVQHGFGWPLTSGSSGGAFLYHYDDNLVSVGFVVHLNYANPTLSPFDEFQRFKTHPMIAKTFAGGKRLAYGAWAISGGGWQSVPKLSFPGSPASDTSAFNRMRAFVSDCAGCLPAQIIASSRSRSSALNFTTYFLTEISLPATNHLHRRIAATEIQKNTTDSMTLATRSRWRDWDHRNAAFGSFQLFAGTTKAVRGRSVMGVPTAV